MSGPITRQYGVPNWDDIFGEKKKETEAEKQSKSPPPQASDDPAKANDPSPTESTK